MSSPVDPSTNLNDCGCCEGVSKETPAKVDNRPGLSAIAYRVGTHSQFKETMLARLSGSRQRALTALTTREDDDFSIALLDAWATVSDVLTFYQERIANEAYLRTATERLSVSELARLIGYQLQPGVSASVYLAFTIEDAPGALGPAINLGSSAGVVLEPPPPVPVDAGVKVQSIPGPGEKAQTYETAEAIEARAEWNGIKPRLKQPQRILTTMGSVIIKGQATNLTKGDTLLLIDDSNARATRVASVVTVDSDADLTRVDFETPALSPATLVRPTLPPGAVADFPTKTELNDGIIQQIVSKSWSEEDLSALAEVQGWPEAAVASGINEFVARRALAPGLGVFAFRQRAAVFGYNAPRWSSLPPTLRFKHKTENVKDDGTLDDPKVEPGAFPTDWEGRTLQTDANDRNLPNSVDLDNAYPNLVKNGWIVLSGPSVQPTVFKIDDSRELTRTDFAISGKVSRLTLDAATSFQALTIRGTNVLAQSEQLAPADVPVMDVVAGNTLVLDGAYLGLKTGRTVILTGARSDLPSEIVSETRRLEEVRIEAGFTVLVFDRELTYSYLRPTVTINANVALATHGESVEEVLGGGDATKPFQSFTLRQPPLTYVGASTASGGQTTLEVRVNDVLWHEILSFYDHGPEERIYVTRLDDDGKTTVIFGDGTTGARLPTGQENVKAKYRKGIGLEGLVKADHLTQLMTRPLGVKGVTNPIAAAGGADPERVEDARRNAPLTVLTLGRVVSLRDYEDFASAFGGIDKALATWTWFGEKRGVFVTVAGSKGAEVKHDSELYKNLVKAMQDAGDPSVPLLVKSYQSRLFRLSAAVKVDPDFLPDKVLSEVEQKLRDTYSFDARAFGQPVHLSEIIGVIQNGRGVVAVDVNEFYRSDQAADRKPRIAAAVPQPGDDEIFPAELLTLDPRPLGLEVLK